ncbi:MAG: hypothetical protein JO314_07875, partial [Acidobacteria bacterium]|nr:hypothetical protein [Acidobacteriota bacterium]
MSSLKYNVMAAALVLAGGVVAASGQIETGPYGMKFHTSFAFTVADKTMPAGDYTVRHLGGQRDSRYSLIL